MGKFSAFVSNTLYSNTFCPFPSLSSPQTPIMHLSICLVVSYRSLMFCLFLFILFSFCPSDCVISITLSLSLLILSSACSNLMLNLSSGFFHFSYTFQLQNFYLAPFCVSVFYLIFSFSSSMIFLISCSSLSLVPFSSSSIFKN